MSGFYMDAGNMNLGPHVCMTGVPPVEPSSQPSPISSLVVECNKVSKSFVVTEMTTTYSDLVRNGYL